MNIVLSTRNPKKIEEVKAIFGGSQVLVMSLVDACITSEPGEETGATIEENASQKAWFAYLRMHKNIRWAMADDTGLFITILRNHPGHLAARWAGKDTTDEEIARYTLKRLLGHGERAAIFRTAVVVIDSHGREKFFIGEMKGKILFEPRVPPEPHMPYSGIFQPAGQTKVLAEMTVDEKNAISQRGIAFRKAREYLEAHMTTQSG